MNLSPLLPDLIKKIVLKIIKIYQNTLSPDHGPLFQHKFPRGFCRFQPTCSEYCYQAVEKYGALIGLWMGLKRVLRCNPWNPGGYDPVK